MCILSGMLICQICIYPLSIHIHLPNAHTSNKYYAHMSHMCIQTPKCSYVIYVYALSQYTHTCQNVHTIYPADRAWWCLSLSLSLILSHTHAHTLSVSLCLSLSHTCESDPEIYPADRARNWQTHSLWLSDTHTQLYTLYLSLSVSLCHTFAWAATRST